MNKKVLQKGLWLVALLLGLMFMQFPAIAEAQTVLNNDRLRFGTGSENSVNTTGNLQQPFYYNSTLSTWRKLTFSTYPLDFEVREGGDGTNWWNKNGGSAYNPVLSGQVINTDGFTPYEEGAKGYGTIISTGTITVNGKFLEIRNTYELAQTKSYIKVTTRFTNTSGGAMSNLRYWVGTQDDYVGGTDNPRKEKGNLVDGEFVQITNPSTPAHTLRISTGDEGVLFYTDTDMANIIIGDEYGWSSYIISRNPVDSPIDSSQDQSYAFYVRLNDLAAGESDEIVWYYAAGELADLEDIVKDVAKEFSIALGWNEKHLTLV